MAPRVQKSSPSKKPAAAPVEKKVPSSTKKAAPKSSPTKNSSPQTEDCASRTFTIVYSSFGFTGGTYNHTSPHNAAKKAGRMLFVRYERSKKTKAAASPKRNNATVTFIIAERVAPRKLGDTKFTYTTVRNRKAKPDVFTVGGREVISEYDYDTKAVRGDEKEKLSEMYNANKPVRRRTSKKSTPTEKSAPAAAKVSKKTVSKSSAKSAPAESPPSPMKAAVTRKKAAGGRGSKGASASIATTPTVE